MSPERQSPGAPNKRPSLFLTLEFGRFGAAGDRLAEREERRQHVPVWASMMAGADRRSQSTALHFSEVESGQPHH